MPRIQHQDVAPDEPLSTVNATYVKPSVKEKLAPGAKLEHLYMLNANTPYFCQRLTERTYFFGGGFYTTTFYVGDEGVLVFDPPENQGPNLLKAITEVSDLPVRAIAYSHNHADHIVSGKDLLEGAIAAGVNNVRIIASEKTKEKMELLKCTLLPPNETVAWPKSCFRFEGLTVQLHGFSRAAHTDDAAAYLLVEEKVLHLPDLINPDQPPFWNFGTAENYVYYRPNVNEVGALDWTYLVGGHGNIGSKDDIRFYKNFLDDLEAAVGEAMAKVSFGDVSDITKLNNHAALMAPWLEAIGKTTTEALRPKYGKFYAFELTTPANATMVTLSKISYR